MLIIDKISIAARPSTANYVLVSNRHRRISQTAETGNLLLAIYANRITRAN